MHDAHFAVVVGINRYPAMSDLRGPVPDAERFVRWLTDPGGGSVPVGNVILVQAPPSDRQSSAEDAEPAKYHIDKAFRKVNGAILERTKNDSEAWNRSRLYLFLAGHGVVPDDSDAVALLTANAGHDNLSANLEVGGYKRYYRRSGCFREVVIFADCCRNARSGVGSGWPPFDREDDVDRVVRIVGGYAAELGRPSYEDALGDDGPDDRRGHFTHALLEGLQQARGADQARITWPELCAFIGMALHQSTASRGRHQNADFFGSDDKVTFGPPAGRPAPRQPGTTYQTTIHFTGEEPDAEVDLVDGSLSVIDTWYPRNGKWSKDLPAGLYGVRRRGTKELIGSPFAVAGAAVDVDI